VRNRARRLLLIPAVALVLLGTPALALDGTAVPPPGNTEVPLALPDGAGPGARAVAKADADLVGVRWRGDPEAEFTIEVRRGDSGAWEPAATLGGDDVVPDEGSPDARASADAHADAHYTEPVWVEDTAAVRVTVVSGTVEDVGLEAVTADDGRAPSGSAGALGLSLPAGPDRTGYAVALLLAGALLGSVALGWSPWRSRRQAALASVVALVALTACVPPPPSPPHGTPPPQPAMTMRTSWGPDLGWNPSPDCAPGPEYAGDVNFLVVHHTVNSNTYGASDSRNMVRAIWSYHVNTLGYCDIAYNFIVDRYGQIFEGRRGGVDKAVIAAHTGGFNRDSSGAAFLGDFTSVQPTTEAWNAMVDLIAWKLSVHRKNPADGFSATSAGFGSRWPAGTSVSFASRIQGHRDLWATACPGNAFYPRLQELRDAVQPKVGWDGPVATTTTTTTTTTAPPTTTTTAVPLGLQDVPVVTTAPTPTTTTTVSTVPTTGPPAPGG